MEALKKLAKARDEYNAMIEKAGKEAVLEAAGQVFEAHAQINRIEWTQYTPYFNDGEPCVFRVHDVDFFGDAGDSSGEDAEDREDSIAILKWIKGGEREILLAKAYEFSNLIEKNEDLMETLGEGKVVITRNGIEVEEYDHD